MVKHLNAQVAAFRNRPLDAGTTLHLGRCTAPESARERPDRQRHALIAVGVNTDGHREILGASWLAFLRSLIARGLSGVQLVISDAHTGLVNAIGPVLPGAS
jgi:transposase-like protein